MQRFEFTTTGGFHACTIEAPTAGEARRMAEGRTSVRPLYCTHLSDGYRPAGGLTGMSGDPAADSAEAMQEQHAREDLAADVILQRAAAGDASAARVAEIAAQRVADRVNSCFESAVWSVTYQDGYKRGRSDARMGSGGCAEDATDGYRAGYARGYAWGCDHPEVLTVA